MGWSRGLGRAKDGARILRYFRGCHRLLPQNWLFSGVGPEPLSQWFSKCDPQSSSSLTWELVEMKILRPHPDRVKSEAGGLEEPRVLWWALWGPWCTLGLSTTLSQSVSPLFSPSVLLRGGPQDSWDKKWEAGQGGEEGASAAQPPPSPRWNGAAGAQGEGRLPALGYNFGLRHNKIPLFRAVKKVRCCWVFVFFCLGCFLGELKEYVPSVNASLERILSPCQEQVLQNVWVPCVVINPVLSLKWILYWQVSSEWGAANGFEKNAELGSVSVHRNAGGRVRGGWGGGQGCDQTFDFMP